MKYFCGLILCFIFIGELKAQGPAMLKGVVVETTPKGAIEPIVGAIVHWKGSRNSAVTDANGVFNIAIDYTSNVLIVQAMGFKTDSILVDGKNYLKVLMISKRNFEDVVISYERKSSEVAFLDPWKTTIMNEKELFKAACCNLSESFETNPSVDVAYTDAITGSRQIQMLGLGGQYTQMSQEQMPGIRGIATNFGLNYIPGTWINAIQVSKGMGSVVNGFESISGQINVELHKPTVKEKVYLNGYASEGGRYELNLVLAQQVTKKISHALFFHGSTYALKMDRNNDGYLDNPIGNQGNVLYRLFFDSKTGVVFHGGLQFLADKKIGGEVSFEENMHDTTHHTAYGTQIDAVRLNAWMKLGYVFPKAKYRSIGLQVNGSDQTYDNFFGNNLYKGTQKSVYANLIYQDIIGNTNHKYRTGLSNQSDWVNEDLFNTIEYTFDRKEVVSGAFFEYTYSYLAVFTLVAGNRLDYHNYFGWKFVPRLHLRYAPLATTVFRAVAGKGWRTSNVVSENLTSLISARKWVFKEPFGSNRIYGFEEEQAWNFGVNVNHDFKLNYRNGSLGIDYYYTLFNKQVVVDRDMNAQQVHFYSLDGASYSRSLQVQLDYQPLRRFDVRFAYRWLDVKTQYADKLNAVPLLAQNRWFFNTSYTTKSKWNFDLTLNWVGEKRLPSTVNNPIDLQLSPYSESFVLVNAQVSKSFKKRVDVYVGCENILDFKQTNPILDSKNPFGGNFDASMIWGPVFGRMFYTGFRWKL